jgi:hypothetical protein
MVGQARGFEPVGIVAPLAGRDALRRALAARGPLEPRPSGRSDRVRGGSRRERRLAGERAEPIPSRSRERAS